MHELIEQIANVTRGMYKYRWQGVLVAWIVAIAGVIVVLRIPDQYEASARIFVDTQSILKPLMSGLAVQPDVNQQVTMLSRTLITRPNVEKLVRMADLDLENGTRLEQDALVDHLMKTLQIKSADRDNLYLLSFRDSDSERAKRAVQSLVSIFVESSMGASRKDTDSAKVFINEQIKSYQQKLEEAEARLKEFRLKNIDMQFADGKDAATRLNELSAQLEAARLELREAENARNAAKAALAAETSGQSNMGFATGQSLLDESAVTVSTPEIDARIEFQRKNLDALLQRFTEQHPEVISTRRLLKDLEAQKVVEVAKARKRAAAVPSIAGSNSGVSPATLEMSRVLASSEVQIAALRARVSEYEYRYNDAHSKIRMSPKIEAEAAQLNRDYAIHKKNYEDLVARREAAAMSGDLDVASGMADFRLVEPPRVSPKPVSPNRLLLLPAALVLSLFAGVFTAFAASQLRPVFHRAAEVRAKIELPFLGVVSLIQTEADRRRERVDLLRFSAASAGLVVVFLGGMLAVSMMAGR
ncbi:chain length-determining protein [Aquincola tertiaricarbonis]|uniref:Chain length-determining protein n=1 Tax=Aquincola tertiaricarbonis TaxID=391953 RepID=A0A1S6R6G9_AQUTE|nr:XrtA system polysaccharide chain length determinant [Aquincola tertiaricarbonis]AQW45576.1 lipopolysaccharide biosynthesis chain length determinant protein [Aquincola tertiaricarbonis]URI10239.1 chain length-determining protein [Aquincola tertiaricarbonis]